MESNVSVTPVNNSSLFEKARNAANRSIASSKNLPMMRTGSQSPLSLLQKKLMQKEEYINFNPKDKIPPFIMSPFPLNWISQDQSSLSLTDMSFTDLYKEFPKSPQNKKEIADTLQKKRRDDIELILTNMQELSSLAKAPLKSKKHLLNRSLEVPRNALQTFFENVNTRAEQEKMSRQLDDSLTVMLKKKSLLRNHYRRKSCYCNLCGGMSHLEQEIQNNPCILPVMRMVPKRSQSIYKSKKGFGMIKSELGNLLAIGKKPSFSSKQTPTNKKLGSRTQISTQEIAKSVKTIKEDMSEQPKVLKNDDGKERKKDVNTENTQQINQQGISSKAPQAILDKSKKSNLLQPNPIENVHSRKQSQTKIQLSVNGSPKNFVIIKSLSPNPIDRRQSNTLVKQRPTIGGIVKNLAAKRLRTDNSTNMGSVSSTSQRNLSVVSDSSPQGSTLQKDFIKGSVNVSKNKMTELPSFHKKYQDSRDLIITKQNERIKTDMNTSDMNVQHRASIKNALKNIVTSPKQETCQLDNHDLNERSESQKIRKIKSPAKKKLTDLMSNEFKGRNQTVLNVYLSSTTSYFKNPNVRMETSPRHSKDFKETNNTEGPKRVGSPEIYLRRLIDCKKKKGKQKSNVE